jgi:hypothetical protein
LDVGPGRLTFSLAPIDTAGEPLFEARHILTLTGAERTTARLVIEVSHPRPEAAPAIAGLEPGWHQLLDRLDQFLCTR